ncbi:hypothetical protein [Caldithrix abyssi]
MTKGLFEWLNSGRLVIPFLAFARIWPTQESLTPLEIIFHAQRLLGGVSKAKLNVYFFNIMQNLTLTHTPCPSLPKIGREGIKGGEGKKKFIKIQCL